MSQWAPGLARLPDCRIAYIYMAWSADDRSSSVPLPCCVASSDCKQRVTGINETIIAASKPGEIQMLTLWHMVCDV